jgi:hypothetical protein
METIDELIYELICGHELVGEIDGEPAGVLNVKEDYVTFFVRSKGRRISIDIPEEDFGPDTVLYKGKTLREILEEGIIYNAVLY